MTPKKGDRVAMAIIAVMTLLMLLFAGMCTLVPSFALTMGERYAALLRGSVMLRVVLTLVVLALMEFVCYKTWMMLFAKPEGKLDTLALKNGEGGEIRVSLQALEAMARRAVGDVDGVREMSVAISGSETALSVKIDLKVTTKARIPEVTANMQKTVRETIVNFTGVAVDEVAVLVSDIVPEAEDNQAAKPGKN